MKTTATIAAILALGSAVGAQDAARPADNAGQLVKNLELPLKRNAAIEDLLRHGAKAAPDLGRALSDPRPEVVLTVAAILYELGPDGAAARQALEELGRSKDHRLAYAGRWALRSVAPRKGMVLVAAGDRGQVVAIDIETGEVQGKPIAMRPKVFDCERLPNGNLLSVNWRQHEVREVDTEGRIVWNYKELGAPMDVDALPDGNVLIADMSKNRVVEIDRSGKVLWQFSCEDPYNADRLPNGNTLIANFKGEVLEVDRGGRVVWRFKCRSPMDAKRLPNGNTLIATWSNQVLVVTPEGKAVRKHALEDSAYAARMLPGGDILVAGDFGVARLDQKGKAKWTRAIGSVGSLELY